MFRFNRGNIIMLSVTLACVAAGCAVFMFYKKYRDQQLRINNLENEFTTIKNTIFAYNMSNTDRGIEYSESSDESEEDIPYTDDIDVEAVIEDIEDESEESSVIEDVPENFE